MPPSAAKLMPPQRARTEKEQEKRRKGKERTRAEKEEARIGVRAPAALQETARHVRTDPRPAKFLASSSSSSVTAARAMIARLRIARPPRQRLQNMASRKAPRATSRRFHPVPSRTRRSPASRRVKESANTVPSASSHMTPPCLHARKLQSPSRRRRRRANPVERGPLPRRTANDKSRRPALGPSPVLRVWPRQATEPPLASLVHVTSHLATYSNTIQIRTLTMTTHTVLHQWNTNLATTCHAE